MSFLAKTQLLNNMLQEILYLAPKDGGKLFIMLKGLKMRVLN